MSFEFLNF